jgi:hypothetical protein
MPQVNIVTSDIELILALGVMILVLAAVVVMIWGIVDAAMRPEAAWTRAGQNKVLWIILMAAGLLGCGPVGLVLVMVYFATVRPKLVAPDPWAAKAGGGPAPDL